jgi:hypothetical protein
MKAAALIVECDDGWIHAIGGNSLEPLRAMARAVRDSGVIDIGKKSVPVRCGTVLSSWRASPDMRFRIRK